jgi:hypothetical protein
MNYLKIFYFTYIISITPTANAIAEFNQELISNIFIPLETEISLDFLKIQIRKNQIILQDDWNELQSKIIINKAESIVKTSPKDLREKIKEKIIGYFKDIDITIFFTQDNMIVKEDNYADSNKLLFEKKLEEENKQRLLEEQILAQEKYKKLHPETTTHTNSKHKKIHGARRTMNKLKRRYAEEQKKKKEHHHELLEAIHAHLTEHPSKRSSSKSSTKKSSSIISKPKNPIDSKTEDYDKKESPKDIQPESRNIAPKARYITPKTRPFKQSLQQDEHSDIYKPFEPEEE